MSSDILERNEQRVEMSSDIHERNEQRVRDVLGHP